MARQKSFKGWQYGYDAYVRKTKAVATSVYTNFITTGHCALVAICAPRGRRWGGVTPLRTPLPKMSKSFLESYGGQTIQQLIAMKDSHRIDSLVLAVEQALGSTPEAELSEPERVVLAVEAMEREVNNGGHEQFFGNSSREFTGFLVRALELIGCPKVASISADAIAVLQLPEHFDADTVEQVAFDLSDDARDKLGECDSRYYTNDENIEQRLFAYIEEHQHEIRIPHAG